MTRFPASAVRQTETRTGYPDGQRVPINIGAIVNVAINEIARETCHA